MKKHITKCENAITKVIAAMHDTKYITKNNCGWTKCSNGVKTSYGQDTGPKNDADKKAHYTLKFNACPCRHIQVEVTTTYYLNTNPNHKMV